MNGTPSGVFVFLQLTTIVVLIRKSVLGDDAIRNVSSKKQKKKKKKPPLYFLHWLLQR